MAGNKVFNENNIRLNVKLDSKKMQSGQQAAC